MSVAVHLPCGARSTLLSVGGISGLLLVYIILGPVVWAFLALSMLAGRRRMALLERRAVDLPDPPPDVTILLPAKDEEAGIADCIAAVLAQDYPNFHVIAIDDRSEDRTGAILDELAARDASRGRRLTVLHVPHGALPVGWTGKCHALDLAW